MRGLRTFALAAMCFVLAPLATAQAGIFIGVGIPGPYYRAYHRPYYYYGPRVYVAPAPVYVTPTPVYVAPAPAPVYVQPAQTVIQTPVTQPVPAPRPINN